MLINKKTTKPKLKQSMRLIIDQPYAIRILNNNKAARAPNIQLNNSETKLCHN